ncbi:MAG: rhomboid family intramembrane serine protease [Bacteroidales bacterium]|nr:rhomboid family intramembrane serine protease [Bacteroidales bacterium]MCF8386630.1 rhomboid family intramembrane serine protease [Bacteroidales bacterium]MCF8398934.1 rhomboid family intramembrane serine protease [Bacteroidales bacterium]
MGFRILPPVVKNLLILNILFFLATIALNSAYGVDLIKYLGLHYWAAEDFQPYQFITYMFMHGGFMHLFFNMFALWMFGNALENVWGPKRFLIYYFVTGIGAAIVHYLVFYFQISPILGAINNFVQDPSNEKLMAFLNSENFKVTSQEIQNNYNLFANKYNSLINRDPSRALQEGINFMQQYKTDFLNSSVVVGASGAVFGILLAFGMLFPNALIYIYFAIPIKAKWFVIIYGAIELYSGIANNPGDNVAHFAHLGGMIFGYFLIRYWKRH